MNPSNKRIDKRRRHTNNHPSTLKQHPPTIPLTRMKPNNQLVRANTKHKLGSCSQHQQEQHYNKPQSTQLQPPTKQYHGKFPIPTTFTSLYT